MKIDDIFVKFSLILYHNVFFIHNIPVGITGGLI